MPTDEKDNAIAPLVEKITAMETEIATLKEEIKSATELNRALLSSKKVSTNDSDNEGNHKQELESKFAKFLSGK